MLGGQPRDSYLTGREVVERLDRLAAGCPVREGVRVSRLLPDGDRWLVRTGGGDIRARTVVVATGCQITEELLAAGRRVVLATSLVERAPARHRGRDTVEWLVESGFFDQRPAALPDPSMMAAPQPLLARAGTA